MVRFIFLESVSRRGIRARKETGNGDSKDDIKGLPGVLKNLGCGFIDFYEFFSIIERNRLSFYAEHAEALTDAAGHDGC